MADEQDGPQNRRSRRAAAKASGKPVAAPTLTPKLKLAQPDYSKPKGTTLLDLYNDKSELLDQGQPFDARHKDGRARDEEGRVLQPRPNEEEVIGPVAEAFFWAVSLSMLHFTLDVLTQNQYRQELDWQSLVTRSATAFPVLWLLVYVARLKPIKRRHLMRQWSFFGTAVAAGCYTIRVANKFSYYAVMKQAPPLSTLWIWSVIEMDLPFAVLSLLINGGYLWHNGFSVF